MKVSICCETYNHEKYVQTALKSFLEQECDFDYEIIVNDDCSTDRTIEKIKEIQQTDPSGKIKIESSKKNEGMYVNFTNALNRCTGEYIAFCEGDDYWIDKHKLQKQVNYMDAHPECSMTFHDVFIFDEKNNKTTEYKFDKTIPLNFDSVAGKAYGHLSSIMVRNFFRKLEAGWEKKYKPTHAPLHYLSLMHGEIHHIDGIMSVYRHSGDGVWSRLTDEERYKWNIKSCKEHLNQYDSRFYKGFMTTIINNEYALSFCYLEKKNIFLFLKYQYLAIANTIKIKGWRQGLNQLKHTFKKLK